MENQNKLHQLYMQYERCENCSLSKTRTNIVFGDGNPNSDIVFIGEGPGYNEDIEGIPFCGAAGHLLDNYLDFVGASREDIYITNVVKCRPPNNRNPYAEEIKSCHEILKGQLDIISPKIIVTLGNVATKVFLNLKEGITELRGRWFEKNNYRILPMFHPAALLRDPSKKRDTAHDFELLQRHLILSRNRRVFVDKIKNL